MLRAAADTRHKHEQKKTVFAEKVPAGYRPEGSLNKRFRRAVASGP